MIAGAMPTTIKRKRVVFVDNKNWNLVENLAQEKKISRSQALRKILGEWRQNG